MKKAVAYIRVSTKSKTQLHSYEYQVEYWEDMLKENPNYEFSGVYADKGISGRWLAKRPQLNQLLEDAREGKFEVVFTKSVARFSRNTQELLEMVRELRDLGVEVIFEKENINTFNPSAELYMTIAAAVAENDLRIYSENQRWSYKKRFENGYVWAGHRILGYNMNYQTNTLEIIEEEAKTVRRIFELYQEGLGLSSIAYILEKEGHINTKGECKWQKGSIKYIVRNEKYKGCSLAQKTIQKLGKKYINKGMAKQYYIQNTHDPIIEPEIFDKVQRIYESRACKEQIGRGVIPPYPFTGKIICGVCGHNYNHKFNHCSKPYRSAIWTCMHQNSYNKRVCDNSRIKDDVLKEKFVEAYNEFIANKPKDDIEEKLREKLKILLKDESELTALKVNRLIEIKAYNSEVEIIRKQIKDVNDELNKHLMRSIAKKDYVHIDEFDEAKVHKFIDIVIINHYNVTFRFINGTEITKPYNNGKPGNKKGWNEKNKLREE